MIDNLNRKMSLNYNTMFQKQETIRELEKEKEKLTELKELYEDWAANFEIANK